MHIVLLNSSGTEVGYLEMTLTNSLNPLSPQIGLVKVVIQQLDAQSAADYFARLFSDIIHNVAQLCLMSSYPISTD